MNQQINLYVAEFRPETNAFQSMFMFQAIAVLLVALSIIFFYGQNRVESVSREIAIVEAQEAAALERLKTIGPLIASMTGEVSWAEQLQDVETTLVQRQAVLDMIESSSFGETSGFSVQMRALARQRIDGIWLTRFVLAADTSRTRLEGKAIRAELVPQYLQALGEERAFSDQRFTRLLIDQDSENTGLPLRFELESTPLEAGALIASANGSRVQ